MPERMLIQGNNIAFRDTAENDLDRIIAVSYTHLRAHET